MALNFDTTLGTSPASWYPQLTLANNAAAAPSPAAGLDIPGLTGPSAPSSAAPSVAPGIAPSPDQPATIPGLGLIGPLRQALAAGGAPNYVGQGLGAATGLANLGLGVANGNPVQSVGGGLGAAGNIANLAGYPGVGAAAGGLGGLLGIYGGINGLVNGGSPVSSGLQLGSGLAGTYGALSTLLPSIFPSLTSALGSAVSSIAPSFASSVGSTLASTAPSVAADAASLGGSLGAGIAAAPAAAITLAYMISGMMDNQKAARDMGLRLKNISGQLPGELGQLGSIPNVVSGLNGANPDQTAAILKQLNGIQEGYQNGGWEDYTKSGGTTVGGGSAGNDITSNLSGVQTALDQMYPALQSLDLGRLRAEDALGKAGWTPDQIAAAGGKYITPIDFALELNNPATKLRPGAAGLFNSALRPDFLSDVMSGNPTDQSRALGNSPSTRAGLSALGLNPDYNYTVGDLQNFLTNGGAGQGRVTSGPLGYTVNSIMDKVNAIKPGQFATAIPQLLAPYGGVNPIFNLS